MIELLGNSLWPHWLRPFWLLLLPLLGMLLWQLWHRKKRSGHWQALLPAAFHGVLLTPGSGRKPRAEKAEVVKSEASKTELKLTISTRRRRNSSVGDLEATTTAAHGASSEDTGVTSTETSAKESHHGDSPSSTVAAKLERATLSSAVKPAPVY